MADDSFDYEEVENLVSQSTVTAWSSQVVRSRMTKTYGRRGSVGALPRTLQKPTPATANYDAAVAEASEILSPSTREESSFGRFIDTSEDQHHLLSFKPVEPIIPGRKRFTRSNSVPIGAFASEPKPVQLMKRTTSLNDQFSLSSSGRSFSHSSGHGSMSSHGAENLHPNHLEPLDELASPKRSARPPFEVRGRKKSRSASMDLRSSSLSNSSSFTNLAREEASVWGKPYSTPSKASQSSADFNELEFLDGASPGLSSVGSGRKRGISDFSPSDHLDEQSVGSISIMGRSGSRPRLFSPPSSHTCEFVLEPIDKPKTPKSTQLYSKKLELMDIASDDGSDSGIESDGDDRSLEEHIKHRRSPLPTFVPYNQRQKRRSTVTTIPQTATEKTSLDPNKASVEDVMDSMPTYNDLRYLTKSLRSQREGSACWHLALPMAWDESRRRKFIKWGTVSLGFTYRKAGAQAGYFQVSKVKGAQFLRLLEATIDACKAQGIGGKTPANKSNSKFRGHFFGDTPSAKTPLGLTITPIPMAVSEKSSDLDPTLMQAMGTLGMSEKPCASSRMSVNKSRSSIILEDSSDNSFHAPRQSMENHSSSHDFMAHLHGAPTPGSAVPLRPPRLSMGSVATQGTISKYSAASPFPYQSDEPPMGSGMKCFTGDFVETPMMKPSGWGSCPVDGRDWGLSQPLQDCKVEELLQILNSSLREAGVSISQEELVEESRPLAFDLEIEAARGGESSLESSRRSSFAEETTRHTMFATASPSSHIAEEDTAEFNLGRMGADSRFSKRRQTAFDKRKRMSLFASATNPASALFKSRKSLFIHSSRPSFARLSFFPDRNLGGEHTFGTSVLAGRASVEDKNDLWHECDSILKTMFSFLNEPDLLRTAFLVNSKWADIATEAHAELMLLSVGCKPSNFLRSDSGEVDSDDEDTVAEKNVIPKLLDRPWSYLSATFPWANFLAEGGFKAVYKVYNHSLRVEEAMSIMDVDLLRDSGEMNMVGMELAVSVMLSSLVRRGVCPNFVMTRGAFSSVFRPPASFWGNENNRHPQGDKYKSPDVKKNFKQPKKRGRYQYIRMELCDLGDTEEYIKTLPGERFDSMQARQLLFQMAFALHTAAIRFSLKHYDVKLLNYFIQSVDSQKSGETVLRYRLGDHIFALKSKCGEGLLAKLADYGTANVDSSTNGQQITIAQFTTLENTPVDFLILGDNACQGHGHDNFGLGLCMLHLFTGHAPYEEILEKVVCPPHLKECLQNIWECEDEDDFSIIRGVVLANVVKDETGHIVDGEPNEVLYDTFYRFLVLFGLPELSGRLRSSKVWIAVLDCLEGKASNAKSRKNKKTDVAQYTRDCKKFSIDRGSNKYIARARNSLEAMDGGMDLLKSLVSFEPSQRFTALDTMNSRFMEPLREGCGDGYGLEDDVRTYTSL